MDEFWRSNPRKIDIIFEAYKLKRDIEDDIAHKEGFYTYVAVSTALGNAFRKKGSKAEPYMEKPLHLMDENKNVEELSDSEKKRMVETLFASLEVMKTNYNINKGGK